MGEPISITAILAVSGARLSCSPRNEEGDAANELASPRSAGIESVGRTSTRSITTDKALLIVSPPKFKQS